MRCASVTLWSTINFDGEFSSILASRFVIFDYLNTLSARQHIRRNRQADLLGCLEVDGQFKL